MPGSLRLQCPALQRAATATTAGEVFAE